MVRVCIEVHNGAVSVRVGIRARNIQRAVSLAKSLYPASDVRVVFPIDPDGFFIDDPFAKEGLLVEGDMSQEERQVA